MKQYKDELLASCLTFILSLPHDIIELDVRAYVPALQVDAFIVLSKSISYTYEFQENMEISRSFHSSHSRCLLIDTPGLSSTSAT